MSDNSLNKRTELLIIFILVAIGFSLRLYASFVVPPIHDEPEKIKIAEEISFDANSLNLPLGNERTRNPLVLPYLMKISSLIFGKNTMAMRFPSVLLGSLMLPILYFLVRMFIDRKTALLCLIFATFSQFLIGSTRVVWEDGILPFFAVSVIFLVQKAVDTKKRSLLFSAGLVFGLGLMVKGTFIILLPATVFYLFVYHKNRRVFVKKDLLWFMIVIGVIISPNVYWNIANKCINYSAYTKEAELSAFSLIPTALYLGEIVVFCMHHLSDRVVYLVTSWEFPFLNWLMGIICIGGAIYFLRERKDSFIVFMSLIFWFVFVLLSFVRATSGGGYYFHLDNFWWAVVSVVPGFILGSTMLVRLSRQYGFMKYVVVLIACYFIINAIQFVNFPANCFVPRRSVRISELHKTAEYYMNEGREDKARKVHDYIKKHYGG